jgi:hypothetical protein
MILIPSLLHSGEIKVIVVLTPVPSRESGVPCSVKTSRPIRFLKIALIS